MENVDKCGEKTLKTFFLLAENICFWGGLQVVVVVYFGKLKYPFLRKVDTFCEIFYLVKNPIFCLFFKVEMGNFRPVLSKCALEKETIDFLGLILIYTEAILNHSDRVKGLYNGKTLGLKSLYITKQL